jgi:DNA-binding transcriptional LysR family regulator
MYGLLVSFSDADPLPGSELAAFTAAVESGSVQAAADALDLTQSAATKRIQNLERRLGQPLLSRGRAGTVPTEFGRTLYPLAKQALQSLADVGHAAERAGAASAATLRLSASLTTGEFLVPGWLGSFRAEHPDVHPQLEIVNSNQVAERVSEGQAELGFVEGLDDLERFETLTVARDELQVVVAGGHRWARRRAVRPRELLSEPYLTRERNSGTRAVADAALAAVGVQLTPALEAASLQSLKRAVAGGGFTVISTLTIEAEERAGSLIGLPVSGTDMSRELHAIRLPGARHGAAATALWEWLQASIRLLPR